MIYARRPDGGKNPEAGYTIDEGEPIDVETACVSIIELEIRSRNSNSKLELEIRTRNWNLKRICDYGIFFRI